MKAGVTFCYYIYIFYVSFLHVNTFILFFLTSPMYIPGLSKTCYLYDLL